MPSEQPLTLRVANRKDFYFLIGILSLLAVLSALLSPQPVLLMVLVSLALGALWVGSILDFHKINNVNLISVIFPDGTVKLKSDSVDTIEGFLDGQQWCTHRVAILRTISKRGGTQKLVILSRQQHSSDEFRRLNMWLRQDFCKDTRERRVSLG